MSDLNAEKFCLLLAHIIKEQEMSDWIEVDLELLWNLLPQSVLRGLSNGEATYYLTLVSSAANINTKGYRHSTSSAQTVLIGPANTQILVSFVISFVLRFYTPLSAEAIRFKRSTPKPNFTSFYSS